MEQPRGLKVGWLCLALNFLVRQVLPHLRTFYKDTSTADLLNLGLQLCSFFIAIYVLILARRQILPALEDIKRTASVQAREARYRSALIAPKNPVRVVGFDARFSPGDWSEILGGGAAPHTIVLELQRSYKLFYDQVEKPADPSQPPFNGPTVIILAQARIPQYLAAGLIEPLPTELGLDAMLDERSRLRGQPCDPAIRRLIKLLFSDDSGAAGALPLWLNSHGRMIPDPQLAYTAKQERLVTVSTLDALFKLGPAPLSHASIQSYHVMLEFWAHLAYRGCRLFRSSDEGGRRFRSELLSSSEQLQAFARATADLATRLLFSDRTRAIYRSARDEDELKDSSKFRIGHDEDARMLREGLALWKPVFSSELLWKALPRRGDPATQLSNDTEFKTPFLRHEGPDDWSYLTALGGYGLAMPTGTSKNKDCRRALKYMFLANPALHHPSLATMLGRYDSDTAVREFAERHGRPRWPFWKEVELELRSTLFALLLSLDRRGTIGPAKFWKSAVDRVVDSRPTLVAFFERVQKIAQAAPPWTFEFS